MNPLFSALVILGLSAVEPTADPVAEALAKPILDANRTLAETRDFITTRLPAMPEVHSAEEWTKKAAEYRKNTLDHVVFRGEAARWRTLPTNPEWLATIDGGPGYQIRKVRYEVVPGLRISALLYEPTDPASGPIPAALVVNGHDALGTAGLDKQLLCINLAKKGIRSLSTEWYGMGQLKTPGFGHGLINAIDLCGTSGVALHFLAMSRGVDILLALDRADPARLAVTGLSGGGWQTIFFSALDPRVTLTDPVAGYSAFPTRIHYLTDLGDSEQTSCDLATVVDYTHLTAMMAPRPTLLTFNAKDNCCFAAPHALPPLLAACRPIFRLYGREGDLRSHENFDPGTHNYGEDNRRAFYQFLSDHWSRFDAVISPAEIAAEGEAKTPAQLAVDLPADNLDFRKLAVKLAAELPRGGGPDLRAVVRPYDLEARAKPVGDEVKDGLTVRRWEVAIGTSWTVPAVELARGEPKKTAILVSDAGRKGASARARALLDDGYRVIAIDPSAFGEAAIPTHAYLFSLVIGTIGERPLGIESGEVMAVSRWRQNLDGAAPVVVADGPRTALIALVSAALEPKAIAGVELHGPIPTLREIVASGREYPESPEVFCFGLLGATDLDDLKARIAPRPVRLVP